MLQSGLFTLLSLISLATVVLPIKSYVLRSAFISLSTEFKSPRPVAGLCRTDAPAPTVRSFLRACEFLVIPSAQALLLAIRMTVYSLNTFSAHPVS